MSNTNSEKQVLVKVRNLKKYFEVEKGVFFKSY